ncbi:two-component sensor histidine kinase [Pseudomonas syringae]|uniref:ATP-binding protein n=1 Tax=Pseudomonas syringae TaxID=317 RepID=UPI001CA98140|nr:ATP-binding protein [Pseudomonas syringae]MCI3945636.1 two-component sensor histidine kinase [Pseudomonas syringae]
MSLRSRLTLILGASFIVLWTLAAAWMLCDLQRNVSQSFDERLAASARLVISLIPSSPAAIRKFDLLNAERSEAAKSVLSNGMACQVTSLRGEIFVQSHNAPGQTLGALGEGYHNQVVNGVEWRTFTLEIDGVRISTADRVDQRKTLKYSILFAAAVPVLVSLMGSLILLWIGVGKGLEPLSRIKDALVRRNADCLDPLDIGKLPAELKLLVDSQNGLLARIAEAIERERRLTGDAAHELRSPLTAIKTHIQVAQLTEGEVAQNAMRKAEEGADRLQRILEQLLLLARVEGRLSFEDGQSTLPGDVAKQALADSAQQGSVVLVIQKEVESLPLNVPAVLATAALRNLIDNALRHTRPDTKVDLTISRDGNGVSFRVRDRGYGVSATELTDLTKRFWHKGHAGGSGLGLAIVEAIIVNGNGTLSFSNLIDGFEAVMKLPLAGNRKAS